VGGFGEPLAIGDNTFEMKAQPAVSQDKYRRGSAPRKRHLRVMVRVLFVPLPVLAALPKRHTLSILFPLPPVFANQFQQHLTTQLLSRLLSLFLFFSSSSSSYSYS
jgi:hypothetical protein